MSTTSAYYDLVVKGSRSALRKGDEVYDRATALVTKVVAEGGDSQSVIDALVSTGIDAAQLNRTLTMAIHDASLMLSTVADLLPQIADEVYDRTEIEDIADAAHLLAGRVAFYETLRVSHPDNK